MVAIGSCLPLSQLFGSQQEYLLEAHHEIVSSDEEASVDDLLSPFIREIHTRLQLPADWVPSPLLYEPPSPRLSYRDCLIVERIMTRLLISGSKYNALFNLLDNEFPELFEPASKNVYSTDQA